MLATFQKFAFVTLALLLAQTASATTLVNGPMLAHVDMREASVWLQTDGPSIVRVRYTEVSSQQAQWSLPYETINEFGNTRTQ